MKRQIRFLVFTNRDGITVVNAMKMDDGRITSVSTHSYRIFIAGGPLDSLNSSQCTALANLLHRTEHVEKDIDEAVFYDGNWWATHDYSKRPKILRRHLFAA